MLNESSVLNAKKTTQKRPTAPKRDPSTSQTLPKWSPRPSQIHILSHFVTLFSPLQLGIDFLSCFCCFFVDFLKLEPLNLLIFPRENAIFYKIDVFEKSTKNTTQNPPKTLQNQLKIEEKTTSKTSLKQMGRSFWNIFQLFPTVSDFFQFFQIFFVRSNTFTAGWVCISII